MQRIVPARYPSVSSASRYRDYDAATGLPGSWVPADYFNTTQDELLTVIEGAGLTPSSGDLQQLYKAILRLRGLGAGVQGWETPGTYTFTVPANVRKILVEVWGGGAAGGSTTVGFQGFAGCGGGGGYGWKLLSVTPGETFAVVVGAAGAATSPLGSDGGDGGTSSFGSVLSCTGGTGGKGSSASSLDGGDSGMSTGGDHITMGLGDGSNGFRVTGLSGVLMAPGLGGGPGGRGTAGAGRVAKGPGGGGGGAGPEGGAGGNGQRGKVLVRW